MRRCPGALRSPAPRCTGVPAWARARPGGHARRRDDDVGLGATSSDRTASGPIPFVGTTWQICLAATHFAHEISDRLADRVGAVLLEEVEALDGDLGLVGPG